MIAEPVKRTPEQEIAERQIEEFERNYGAAALDFACHAAFPLTLTTNLAYCLRQKFCGNADWSVAAILLLSDLCSGVGHDLYEIPIATRYCLLERLLKKQGEARLDEIARFMAEYIRYRLTRENDHAVSFHGQPPQWIALAMLKRDQELTELIAAQIAEYLQKGTLSKPERLRLASMIRGQGDLLSERQLEPITLQQLAARVKRGEVIEPSDNLESLRKRLRQAGFPELKTAEIKYAKIVFDETVTQEQESLQNFSFETVRVDAWGQEIEKLPGEAVYYIETLPPGLNLEMVAIPSGKFIMGSPESEHERFGDESPQHEVTVPPFFMGRYAVTQAQWRVVAGLPQVEQELDADPANFKGDNRPVEQVSWRDAVEFCARLSVATGREYRLPSEAEWEYACRAGTTTPFHFGETITGKFANYDSRFVYRNEQKTKWRQETTPIGSFPPNHFGLYEMHGNVFEWCLDHWHNSYEGAPIDGSSWVKENAETQTRRVRRGGSWFYYPGNCRSASRDTNPDNRDYIIGFRVVYCVPRTLS
jgi:formylglycine-generating enzyme required for sulfatase activity